MDADSQSQLTGKEIIEKKIANTKSKIKLINQIKKLEREMLALEKSINVKKQKWYELVKSL